MENRPRSLIAGGTDYTGVDIGVIVDHVRGWYTGTGETITALEGYLKEVEGNTDSFDWPETIRQYITGFIDVFVRYRADFGRLIEELPGGVLDSHLETVSQIYESSRLQEARCVRFSKEYINAQLKNETTRPLLDRVYGDSRDQIVDYRDLSNVRSRLAALRKADHFHLSSMAHGRQRDARTASVIGATILSLLLGIALFLKHPSDFQYTVFRIILAVASTAFVATVPGLLAVRLGTALRAGGALGIFLVVYFLTPVALVTSPPSPSPALRVTQSFGNSRSPYDTSKLMIYNDGSPIYNIRVDLAEFLSVNTRVYDQTDKEIERNLTVPIATYWAGREQFGETTGLLYRLSHEDQTKTSRQLTFMFREAAAQKYPSYQGADIGVETLIRIDCQDTSQQKHTEYFSISNDNIATRLSDADGRKRFATWQAAQKEDYRDVGEQYLAKLWDEILGSFSTTAPKATH